MELPSKELLLEVIGAGELQGLKTFGLSSCETNIILQYEDYDNNINIYELMHMMKEWANSFDISIDSGYDGDIAEAQVYYSSETNLYFHCATEFEAVLEACEHILNQKENNEQA